MKKLFIAISVLFSVTAFSQGVVIADHLNTIGVAQYPTHLDSLQRGGFRVVSTIVERNAITSLRRKIGMWVYVTDSLKTYSLVGGITNSDWAELSLGGSSGAGWLLTGNAGTDFTTNFLGTTDSTGGQSIKNGGTDLMFLQKRGWDSYPYVPRPSLVAIGAYTARTLIARIKAGTTDGGLNVLIGGGVGMDIGSTADGVGTPSDQNTIIGPYSARWMQNNNAVTGNGRNAMVGESECYACITPGENSAVGSFNLEKGFRPYKNSAVGSNALRSGNDAHGMTALGAYTFANAGTIVLAVGVTAGGHYTSRPTVTFTAPAWAEHASCDHVATGYAVMSWNGTDSSVASIVITEPGCGYTETAATYITGVSTMSPPTVSFSGGGGTGATATVTVISAQDGVAIGHTAGWFTRATKRAIYIGYSAQSDARYYDEDCLAIGSGSGIDASISPLTKMYKAWAIGTNAKVSTNNTLAIGAPLSDTNYFKHVVINGITGDSTLDVNGGVKITGGLDVKKVTNLEDTVNITTMGTSDNSNRAASTAFVKNQNYQTGSGINNRVTRWTGTHTQGYGVLTDDGTYAGIDDLTRGDVTTNAFGFFVRNHWPGEGTNLQPFVLIDNLSTSATFKNMLQVTGSAMVSGSRISTSFGKQMSSKDIWFTNFWFNGTNSNSNAYSEDFYAVANVRKVFASSHTVFNGSTDNGYQVEVNGTFHATDTVTATTMGIPDSSNRVATTAWVKRQGYGGGGGGGPFYDSTLMCSVQRLKDSLNQLRSEIPTNVVYRSDIYPITTFGGGANAGTDTAAMNINLIYGSFFTGSGLDSLRISQMMIGLKGTSPNITVTIYWNDSLGVKSSDAKKLVNAGSAATNIYTGTSVTSFDNDKIPPGVWVWAEITAITTKPNYLTITLSGYRDGRIIP